MKWLLLLTIIIILFLLVLRGMKGPTHTLHTLRRPIKDLLKRGFDGGFLIITISSSPYFLQLRKYIEKPGEYGIELAFPKSDWSNDFFINVIELCKNNRLRYSVVEENVTAQMDFIYVNFGKDHNKAYVTVKEIILNIFRIPEDSKFHVRLENATVEDKLIDRK